MIEIKNLVKTYKQSDLKVDALNNINLSIPKGCIYGIIGLSGAGKSSLLRCINRLEEPTSGNIYVQGKNIMDYNKLQLSEYRKNVGMIFQHFHLLTRKSVFQNISFPLDISGIDKDKKTKRVNELLDLVGLSHKAYSYPSQLSGGEKQRVGIARALANNPEILLCDEPTSALDPQTTQSILSLLEEINNKLKITMVIITHQMEVVKGICNRVAVIDQGKIIEEDTVLNVFSSPKNNITKTFVGDLNVSIPMEYTRKTDPEIKLIKIHFPTNAASQPIISQMIKRYDVDANIIAGNINHIQDNTYGQLIIELTGNELELNNAFNSLLNQNLKIEVISYGNN